MAATSADLIGWALKANTHLADLQINVVPGCRRRGIGGSLYADATLRRRAAGRTSACGEVNVVDDKGPLAFARAMGAESVHEEDHLVLDLPMGAERLGQLQARASSDEEIVRWQVAALTT